MPIIEPCEPGRAYLLEFFAYATIGASIPHAALVIETTLADGTVVLSPTWLDWLELFAEDCEYCGRAPCRCLD